MGATKRTERTRSELRDEMQAIMNAVQAVRRALTDPGLLNWLVEPQEDEDAQPQAADEAATMRVLGRLSRRADIAIKAAPKGPGRHGIETEQRCTSAEICALAVAMLWEQVHGTQIAKSDPLWLCDGFWRLSMSCDRQDQSPGWRKLLRLVLNDRDEAEVERLRPVRALIARTMSLPEPVGRKRLE